MTAWYVVYTHTNAENNAVAHLKRQGYDTYLPKYRRWRSHARRRELVQRPLFPRYLFVALDLLETRWRPILSTTGVVNLVRQANRPTQMPDGIVEEIREHERLRIFDEACTPRNLRAGDSVRVMTGPFADLIGRFCCHTEHERVYVLLDLLGREVRTSLPAKALAPT